MKFITKAWLEEHIDWNKLNHVAPLAANAIHDAYFFEFVSRQVAQLDGLATWEILNSKFKKQVYDYHLLRCKDGDFYEIEVRLLGEIDIEFFSEDNHAMLRRANFGAIIELRIVKERISEYDLHFYPEETGLDFSKFLDLTLNLVSADGT